MIQRLGKACRLVDLAHSDARLKKSNYRELGLDSTVAKFRPNFGYIIFFNLASLFARSTRWHAFPNLWLWLAAWLSERRQEWKKGAPAA